MVESATPLWIGRELRALRDLRGARAVDIAHKAGISAEVLNHIERGRRPVTAERGVRILAALSNQQSVGGAL